MQNNVIITTAMVKSPKNTKTTIMLKNSEKKYWSEADIYVYIFKVILICKLKM